ncbi:hypothetical protein NDU88_002451 [Pleurodeles waltl]|uniref:Uncharacterized protein n=1 Tax=Pleurodeles waltl TaxID=8319 RepID=A0AAV7SAZ1_PLEWA|nr:hypothetical protein NDU88_002451 [Pleurodeles waltl]
MILAAWGAKSGGAYFSRQREDPGSGRDGRRQRPGALLRNRGRRCLGVPKRDLTGPPSDSSKAEAAPVTPGPVKRVLERCERRGEASRLQSQAGAGRRNPRLPRVRR